MDTDFSLSLFLSGFAASNISEVYDAKIFAVATILSSYLIYNSVKVSVSFSIYSNHDSYPLLIQIIDQGDIDYLDLLARRTRVRDFCCRVLLLLLLKLCFSLLSFFQLFALRSQITKAKWLDDFNHDLLHFPPLVWVSNCLLEVPFILTLSRSLLFLSLSL